jgi:CHAT domain-containing protein/Tfp pilus assembly protein PilF
MIAFHEPANIQSGSDEVQHMLADGAILRTSGDFSHAIKKFEDALRRSKERSSVGDELTALIQLGILNWNIGEMQKSHIYFEQALALAKIEKSSRDEAYCNGAERINRLYTQAKEKRSAYLHTDSIALFKEAIAIARSMGSQEHELKCLRQLSANYWNINDYDEFYSLNLAALKIAVAIRHHGERGVCNNNIGLYFWKNSNYSKAIKHMQTALEIAESEGLDKDKSDCMTNLALIYLELGDHEKAQEYIANAMDVDVRASDFYNLAVDYNNLGLIYKNQGDSAKTTSLVQKGIECYKKALSLARNLHNRKIECIVGGNLGEAYAGLEEFNKAVFYYGLALDIVSELGDSEVECQLLNNLGNAYLKMGQVEMSRVCFSLAMARAVKEASARFLWEAYFGLGQGWEMQGNKRKALDCYTRSIEIVDRIRSQLLLEAYKIGFTRNKLKVYERLIQLIWENTSLPNYDGREERIFHYVEKIKGRAFLESLAESSIDLFGDMDELQRRSLAESSRRTSALLLELARPDHPEPAQRNIQKNLAQEEDRYFRTLSTFKVDHPGLANLASPDPCKLDAVQRALRNRNTAIIEYFLGERGSFVLEIKSDSLRVFPLAAREKIEKSVQPFLKYLSSPPRKEIEGSKAGRRIFEELLGPLELGKERRLDNLIIIPDGILHFLPFETLRMEGLEGAWPYLIDQYGISYAPSASVLMFLENLKIDQDSYRGILSFGNPFYGTVSAHPMKNPGQASSSFQYAGQVFSSLPHSEEEVNTVSSFFSKGFRHVFTGSEARESTLRKFSRQRYQIIHFAGHALVDELRPFRSALLLSQTPDPEDDGLLLARELYDLQLKANLVVLSACKTATGTLEKAEGVLGLTRIFFYAGARSVLSTLWAIGDRSTVDFMRVFYQHLSTGISKAQALRQTKIEMKRSVYSHPYYWAQFVLSGEPDSPIILN